MLLSITLAVLPAIVSPTASASASWLAFPSPVAIEASGQRGAARVSRNDDTAELVRLQARDKIHLAANYYRPRAKSGRMPGVILVHDAGGDRSELIEIAEYLQKKGFGVLMFDVRGHGQSATDDLSWSGMDESSRTRTWGLASRDLDAAADFLRERPEIHSTNLSLIGFGAGASLALRHAAEDENARAVVLVNPPTEALGYDVAGGMSDLEGLPCLVIAPKEGRDSADGLRVTAQEANGGLEYVEVSVMKSSADKLLKDKRLNNSATTWLRDQVLSKEKK